MISYEELRKNSKAIITVACSTNAGWQNMTQADRDLMITRIERSINNTVARDSDKCDPAMNKKALDNDAYNSQLYRIAFNADTNNVPVNDAGNTALFERMMAENVGLNKICDISTKEMCPDVYEKDRQEIDRRRGQSIQKKYSTIYTCNKCGGKLTDIIRRQTRGADEMESIIAVCVSCKNKWMLQ